MTLTSPLHQPSIRFDSRSLERKFAIFHTPPPPVFQNNFCDRKIANLSVQPSNQSNLENRKFQCNQLYFKPFVELEKLGQDETAISNSLRDGSRRRNWIWNESISGIKRKIGERETRSGKGETRGIESGNDKWTGRAERMEPIDLSLPRLDRRHDPKP